MPTYVRKKFTYFDRYWTSVSYLVHLDTSMLTEEKGHTMQAYGGATLSNTLAKYGTKSLYLDGVNSFLNSQASNHFNMGTRDFTVELSFSPKTKIKNWPAIITNGLWSPGNWGIWHNHPSAPNKVMFGTYNGWGLISTSTIASDSNLWTHVAICRNGTTLRMFINGVQEASATVSGYLDGANDRAEIITLGSNTYGANDNCFKGYIDEVRITKGVGRYTSNFKVPTRTYPNRG